jgi:fatty acid desaturase
MPSNAYAELKRRVSQDGLLERNPRGALAFIGINLLLLALCCAIFGIFRHPLGVVAGAVLLSFISGQWGFVMHEAGHRQMFRRGWQNVATGMLHGNMLLGVSYGYWVRKHNQHHAQPNHLDMDPDIDIPVMAFSPEQVAEKRGFARLIVAYQAFLFVPLMLVQATYMQLYAVYSLITAPPRHRWTELGLIAVHWTIYLGLPLVFLGIWPTLLLVLIRQGLSGMYLASVFAPNHKGMPIIDEHSTLDFLHQQVLTARNINAHPVTDFWYGGLNYQIEHHLFPTVPRGNLRRLQAIVKSFCAEQAISYHETSMLGSFRELFQYLHEISAPLRARTAAATVRKG